MTVGIGVGGAGLGARILSHVSIRVNPTRQITTASAAANTGRFMSHLYLLLGLGTIIAQPVAKHNPAVA